MKRVLCVAVGVALFGAFLAVAEETDVAKWEAQKKELEAKKKELDGKLKEARAQAAKSAALDAQRADVEKARATYEEKRASHSKLNAAKEKEKEAQADLAKVVAGKVADSKETAEAEKQTSGMQAKRTQRLFEKALAQIYLVHEGSPIRIAAEEDKDVKAAREAAAEAEAKAMAKPSEALVKARAAVAEAEAALEKVSGKVGENRDLRKAGEAEREAQTALREAEKKASEKLLEARAELEKARKTAIEDLRAARPHVKELAEVDTEMRALKAVQSGFDYLLDLHGKAMVEKGSPRSVKKAAAALADATEAYNKFLQKGDLAKLQKAVDEAQKTFNEKHDEMFGKLPDYQALKDKETALNAKLKELTDKTMGLKGDDARSVLPEIGKVRAQISETAAAAREIRISTGKEKWDAIWQSRGIAQKALNEKVDRIPDAAAARAAVRDAEKALALAIREACADEKVPASLLKEKEEVAKKMAALRFRDAIARHYLTSPLSEIVRAVESSKAVTKLAAEVRKLEEELRSDPPRAAAKARKEMEEARAEVQKAREKAQSDKDYQAAFAARRETERALREAERADPLRKAVEDAQKAIPEKINAALAKIKDAEPHLKTIAAVDAELAQMDKTRDQLQIQARDMRAKIEKGDDSDVVKARKAAEEARKAVQETEKSEDLLALQKKIEEAAKAVEAKRKDLVAADATVVQLTKDLDAVEKDLAAVTKAIKEAQKPAKKQAPAGK